ncbi:MAG: alkyl hydroperoxide reductase/Thiol specific antioxidant/Mal allergen [Parcubacteria group bacterium]|nr:alkyl hydroperoxide reductase/Thiol specific antioxidant/Mal allergen [Parcubacteria group bacterium]
MPLPTVGSPAPLFTLPDQDGKEHSLTDYKGKHVLIYFYPKDDTPGCTKQACAIRDALPDFSKLNAIVLGISADTVKSHKKFAEKYGLPFTLLADEGKEVVNLYGVWGRKKFMGKEYDGVFRTSFLIGPDGNIKKVYENVKPDLHAEQILKDLESA